MKNWMIAVACVCMSTAFAQQDNVEQQPNDDQLQQQAPRETQKQVERSAKVEAVKDRSNSEMEAEVEAKQKGQTQRQTKTQPVGINPEEPNSKPRDLNKIPKPVSSDRPKN